MLVSVAKLELCGNAEHHRSKLPANLALGERAAGPAGSFGSVHQAGVHYCSTWSAFQSCEGFAGPSPLKNHIHLKPLQIVISETKSSCRDAGGRTADKLPLNWVSSLCSAQSPGAPGGCTRAFMAPSWWWISLCFGGSSATSVALRNSGHFHTAGAGGEGAVGLTARLRSGLGCCYCSFLRGEVGDDITFAWECSAKSNIWTLCLNWMKVLLQCWAEFCLPIVLFVFWGFGFVGFVFFFFSFGTPVTSIP